jgi:hypothetical protein
MSFKLSVRSGKQKNFLPGVEVDLYRSENKLKKNFDERVTANTFED